VCHAAESFLSKPFDTRPAPESPNDRPPYQGSNPVADVWSAKALEYGGRYLRRAVKAETDTEDRGFMMLSATMTGVGFGSAGVHIPHACAYPIAGLKHVYQAPGYPADHPMADMFRWKDVIFGRRLSDREVLSAGLPDLIADGYAAAMPVFRFLATLH